MSTTTRLVLLVALFLATLWCLYWQGRELSGLKRQVAGLVDDLVELRRRLRDAAPATPAVPEPEPADGPPTQPSGLAIDTWQRSLSRRLYHGGHRA
jgi:hypothetical protein